MTYTLVGQRAIGGDGGLEAALLLVGDGRNVVKSTHDGVFIIVGNAKKDMKLTCFILKDPNLRGY